MAEERMWRRKRRDHVVDHVHSKREGPEEQPSETKGRHVAAAIYFLTRCRRKSLVTIVAIIVSIAVLIAVVFVRKHLT